MLIRPLNDIDCLSKLQRKAASYAKKKSVRRFARQFTDTAEVAEHIRSLMQRNDLGDPNDGPRLPCDISQRARFSPSDPNCFERTLLYLALAEILDSKTKRNSASMVVDGGWHTFPIEYRAPYGGYGGYHRQKAQDEHPYIVHLEPTSTKVPRNYMTCCAHEGCRLVPTASRNLVPWFLEVARNACVDADGPEGARRYRNGLRSLRHSMLCGAPMLHIDVDYIMDRAEADSALWGPVGKRAFDRIASSVRNFSWKLDTDRVNRVLGRIYDMGEGLGGDLVKAALIAEFGPVAGVALAGADLAMTQNKPDEADAAKTPPNDSNATQGVNDPQTQPDGTLASPQPTQQSQASSQQNQHWRTLTPGERVRRMSLGFRH